MANGWTPERRTRQTELSQSWRPWQRSTGPTTPHGKDAYRSAQREIIRGMSRVLRAQEGALQGRRAKGRPSQRNVPGWRGWSGVVRLWLSGSIQAFAMVAAGASAPCPPFIAPMFEITVVDEDDSTPICDVRVVAVDGEYSMLLRPDACRYRDVGENRRGTYALEMAKDGYHSLRVDGVVVAPDATGCTVQTVRARYSLKAIR